MGNNLPLNTNAAKDFAEPVVAVEFSGNLARGLRGRPDRGALAIRIFTTARAPPPAPPPPREYPPRCARRT